jgi:hypothetical protein
MPQFISQEKLGEIAAQIPDQNMRRAAVRRMVDRGYEIEGLNAEFSPFEAFGNLGPSTKEFGVSIWQALRHPVQTAEGLGKVVAGGIRKAIPDSIKVEGGKGTENEELFDATMDFFIQRYGSKDKILNTIEKDPVGFMSDVASLLAGIGGGIKAAGVGAVKAAPRVGRGILRTTPVIEAGLESAGVARTSQALLKGAVRAERAVARASRNTEKLLLRTGGATQKTGEWIARNSRLLEPTTAVKKISLVFNKATGISKLADHMAERLSKGTLDISNVREGNLSVTRKESIVNFMNRYGVHGSIPEMIDQLTEIGNKTRRALDAEMGRVQTLYKDRNAGKLLNEMQDAFKKRKNLSDKHTQMRDSIDTLRNKILGQGGLTLSELNEVKRLTKDVLNIFKKSGEPGAGLKVDNLNELRKGLRASIEKKAAANDIPNVRELNQQIQAANTLADQLRKTNKVTRKRRGFIGSLLSAGVLGTAAYTANPLFIGGAGIYFGSQLLLRSPRFRSWAATKLQLLSEGEFRALENGVRLGKWDKLGRKVARDFRNSFRAVLPELRLAGIVGQQGQE